MPQRTRLQNLRRKDMILPIKIRNKRNFEEINENKVKIEGTETFPNNFKRIKPEIVDFKV